MEVHVGANLDITTPREISPGDPCDNIFIYLKYYRNNRNLNEFLCFCFLKLD